MKRAVLRARRSAGADLLLVALDVDEEAALAHTAAGQYVEVTTRGAASFFVLASDPRKTPWELLLRNVGDVAEALSTMPLGSEVDVTMPIGKGFSMTNAGGRDVVVAVVGTAIAVARPVMRMRIAAGDTKKTALYIGARTLSDVPLVDELDAWSTAGARIVLCLSKGGLDEAASVLPCARRTRGYVQDELERAFGEGHIPKGALVVAAGPPPMLEAVRAIGEGNEGKSGRSMHDVLPLLEVVTNV